jgi:hypothetical protein
VSLAKIKQCNERSGDLCNARSEEFNLKISVNPCKLELIERRSQIRVPKPTSSPISEGIVSKVTKSVDDGMGSNRKARKAVNVDLAAGNPEERLRKSIIVINLLSRARKMSLV